MDVYELSDVVLLQRIGQKIRELRLNANLSQKELAERSGISSFSISQIENGHNFSLISLIMIMRALNRLDYLSLFFEDRMLSPIAVLEEEPVRMRSRKSHSAKSNDDMPW